MKTDSIHIELPSIQRISKSALLEIHQNQLQSHRSIEAYTAEIVEIFGGIDQILIDYLSSDVGELSQSKLRNIKLLLSKDTEPCDPVARKYSSSESKQSEIDDSQTPTILLSPSTVKVFTLHDQNTNDSAIATPDNTKLPVSIASTSSTKIVDVMDSASTNSVHFQEITSKQLHHVYYRGESYLTQIIGLQKSEKLTRFMTNKCFIGLCVTSILIWFVWLFLKEVSTFEYRLYKAAVWFIVSCTSMFLILSMNRIAMKQCMSQFVFWFQTYKALESSMWLYLIDYVLLRDETIKAIELVADFWVNIAKILCIALIAATDAWSVSRNMKLFITIAGTLYVGFTAFYSTFMDPNLIQDTSFSIIKGYTMDAQSLYAESNRVLALFMLRQTILTLIRKNECVTIRYAPYVEWKDS